MVQIGRYCLAKTPEGHRWDKSTQLKNAKKLEEYMALNNLTIGD
jgi:hypothetical protein